MNDPTPVTSIIIAGLGGQGVVTASAILAEVAFRAGHNVKQSEIRGLSQRGGSVSADVRFGPAAYSPMTPPGEADYLVVLAADQLEIHRPSLRPGGRLIAPDCLDSAALENKKSLNVGLLGALSTCLDIPVAVWHEAIRTVLPAKLHAANLQAFALGQACRFPRPPRRVRSLPDSLCFASVIERPAK
jgi:indolepyruvate ferredoxin oxidoreductase beta subunit